MPITQSTDTILMVRPANFGYNIETASNNVFQNNQTELSVEEIKERAKDEFDNMVSLLRSHGVNIIIIDDHEDPPLTDAIFPNNWISTHQDGTIYTYPMYSPNRRLERRTDIIQQLSTQYQVTVDDSLLDYESEEKFLEGTGSMILDRPNKIIYACYSVRTHRDTLEAYGKKIGYQVIGFAAEDAQGVPYYHTNVIMTLGEQIAVLCTESIVDHTQKKYVVESLENTGKEIIHITRDQVLQYAGNMLEIKVANNKNLLVMSQAAYQSLKKEQLHIIKNHNKIVSCALDIVEKFGGGSARCMIAEVFLPAKD